MQYIQITIHSTLQYIQITIHSTLQYIQITSTGGQLRNKVILHD